MRKAVAIGAGVAVGGAAAYLIYQHLASQAAQQAEADAADAPSQQPRALPEDAPKPAAAEAAADAPVADPVAAALGDNAGLLSDQDRALVAQLLELDQGHLFRAWPQRGSQDEGKRRLLAQLALLDASYHGGVAAYVRNARKLLQDSKEGANPFEGYVPSVPAGATLDFGSPAFLALEAAGAAEAGAAAFVLVAGGLGERLGYSGIKVALPSECASGTPFLGLYIGSILALQARSQSGRKLPLAIMTSDDTHARTEALLRDHGYFGMEPGQVTLIKQEKVACLTDNAAHLAPDPADPAFGVQTKPHGHGDVHMLLHSSGLARKWLGEGLKWVCFFQDTNALVFRGLLPALGVSAREGYDMNSLAVPRRAKEAIGAIARLEHSNPPPGTPASLTINVEYNQLDPLLRGTMSKEGDVNDPKTGYSPFPGNINQLVLRLASYVPQLEATGGVISEFVNPKYKDATKTDFKSSTRLECMMQDYPKALPASAKVGFTTINQVWASYSPVKNSPADAAAKFKEGNPTHSATTGELDIYKANCLALQDMAGAKLPSPLQSATFNGIATEVYPRVVLTAAFAPTLGEIKAKVAPGSIRLGPGAALVLDGAGISVQGPLEVSGALVVRAVPGAKVVIGPMKVENKGWEWHPIAEGEAASEEERIRGFKVLRHETQELVFDKPGSYTVPEPAAAATAKPAEPAPAAAAKPAEPAAAAAVKPAEASAAKTAAAAPAAAAKPAEPAAAKPAAEAAAAPGPIAAAAAAAKATAASIVPTADAKPAAPGPIAAAAGAGASPAKPAAPSPAPTAIPTPLEAAISAAAASAASSASGLSAAAKPFVPASAAASSSPNGGSKSTSPTPPTSGGGAASGGSGGGAGGGSSGSSKNKKKKKSAAAKAAAAAAASAGASS